MYLDHYGLKETPFSITPDPRFVFLSERHRDALAHLIYGISQGGGGGFVQLTGEVGTGKTTLSRLLLEQLPADTQVALVLNPRLDPVELLEAVCQELHLQVDAIRGSGKALVDALNGYLLDAHARHLKVVLILDEAQQLSVDALEQVRLLTNLETPTHKLLQIVLLGQPELRDLLARPDLRQLAQRITARYHLTPLNAAETADYVDHRLAVAGLTRGPFTADGLKALHRRSGGVPRLINVIAERALVAGYARDATRLDARLVDDAADELLPQMQSAWRRHRYLAIGVAAALVLGIAGWRLLPSWRTTNVPAAAIAQADVAMKPELPSLRSVLADGTDDDGAARALLQQWQAPADLAARLVDCPFLFDGETLHCVRTRGTFAQLAALGRPVLLMVPDGRRVHRVGLLALDAGTATVAIGASTVSFARSELESAWPGEYLALMRLPEAVAPVRGPTLPGWAAAALARFEANRSLPALSKDDDRIRRVQQAHGLRADAVIGPETWWVLSAHLDGGPRLDPPMPAIATR